MVYERHNILHHLYASYCLASARRDSTKSNTTLSYRSSSVFSPRSTSFWCRVASSFVMQTRTDSLRADHFCISLPSPILFRQSRSGGSHLISVILVGSCVTALQPR